MSIPNFICGPGLSAPTECRRCGKRYHRSVELHRCRLGPGIEREKEIEALNNEAIDALVKSLTTQTDYQI